MVGDLAREGIVASVDAKAGTCRVQIGDILTGDIPWLERAGPIRTWCPPEKGEQVVVLAPEADITRGLVIGGIFSSANPAPFDDTDTAGIAFADGAQISYDAAAHALTAKLPGGSSVEVEADDIYLRGNLHVTGFVAAERKVTSGESVEAADDVKVGRVSLKNHVHDKVQAGGAVSGKPVAA